MTSLTPCPEITCNEIQTVDAFVQVCDNLDQFNCEYEDFKNTILETKDSDMEEPDSDGEGEKIIRALDSLVDELKINDIFMGKDNCGKFILNNFGGQNLSNSCNKKIFDKCKGINENFFYDFTKDSHTFLAAVNSMGRKQYIWKCTLFLKGSNSNRKLYEKYRNYALFGSGKHKSKKWWKCIGNILRREKYLTTETQYTKLSRAIVISISAKGKQFLTNVVGNPSTKLLLKPSTEILKLLERNCTSVSDAVPPLTLSSMDATSSNSFQKHNNTLRETKKQEEMHLYRLLLIKRTEIASRLKRTPYMIASDEALLKMAQLKPYNIKALLKCQGFTDDEIMKFGEEFIKIIASTPSLSVEEVLSKNPLVKLTNFGAKCYRLYTLGFSVKKIAKQKHLAFSIIHSQLCDCIRAGKPVNLADLTVTIFARDKIISAIRSPLINSDMTTLTVIKNHCPKIITFNQIRAVVAFLQVCDHLDKFHCEYEDFKNAMINIKHPVQLNYEEMSENETNEELMCQ